MHSKKASAVSVMEEGQKHAVQFTYMCFCYK